jgi:hypothetical protein
VRLEGKDHVMQERRRASLRDVTCITHVAVQLFVPGIFQRQ